MPEAAAPGANDLRQDTAAFRRRQHPVMWLLALAIGLGAAHAAMGFYWGITALEGLLHGAAPNRLSSALMERPALLTLSVLTAGGLLIGLYRKAFRLGPALSVADVIEARAVRGGRLPLVPALHSALVSMTSLGLGASAGREGPVVHLGASLAAAAARRLQLPPTAIRILLGCGVAAAVSASFNAPIAGVLFALEVVLGHYALRAFVPIAIASVAGAGVTRFYLGDYPAFQVPQTDFGSIAQMPIFLVLGIVCAGIAMALMAALIHSQKAADRLPIPDVLRPAVGGLILGAIGLAFPFALGVGYEATDLAIKGEWGWSALALLLLVKIAATAITLASRFGGGVFSPALAIGAMAGGVFGSVAAILMPGLVVSPGIYAMVGMGATAAAVLGAPISTTLILFELTLDYDSATALLISGSVATALTQSIAGHSYFQWQLEQRGLDLRSGAPAALMERIRVAQIMDRVPRTERTVDPEAPALTRDMTLRAALSLLETENLDQVPVVAAKDDRQKIGVVRYEAALKSYNDALVATHIEEHS